MTFHVGDRVFVVPLKRRGKVVKCCSSPSGQVYAIRVFRKNCDSRPVHPRAVDCYAVADQLRPVKPRRKDLRALVEKYGGRVL